MMLRAALWASVLGAPCVATAGFHRVKSFDGTELNANYITPDEITSPLPLVVMGNSWGAPGFEYLWPTEELAKRQYIAVEYEARGFYLSGGKIGTAGPEDLRDHSAVIDWALEHWGDKVNRSAIAAGGISYGAGLALMATANDSRITACFAMSGWASLIDALWWNMAPSLFWSDVLVASGFITGREPKELHVMLDNLLNHKNVNATLAWGNARSPRTYIDAINARKVPVFVTNQFEDNLFHSNFQLDLWQRLQGPKRLVLAQGTHAEADGRGLLPKPGNDIWADALAWMDRFLKGIDNGIDRAPLVEVSLSDHHNPLIPGQPVYTRRKYSSWPPVEAAEKYQVLRFGLQSRSVGGGQFGKLVAGGAAASHDVVRFTKKTEMTCGIPVVGPAIRPWKITSINAEKIDAQYELAFLTEPVAETTRFCGQFNVTGLVATASADNFQVMGYLWSVQPKNLFGSRKASLLTHAPMNIYDARAGRAQALGALTFHAGCRDVKTGEALMLGLNLHNSLYKGANVSDDLSVRFDYSASTSLNVETVAVL